MVFSLGLILLGFALVEHFADFCPDHVNLFHVSVGCDVVLLLLDDISLFVLVYTLFERSNVSRQVLGLVVKVDHLHTETVKSIYSLSKLIDVFSVLADIGKFLLELECVYLVHLVFKSVYHFGQAFSLVFVIIRSCSRASISELSELLPQAFNLLGVSLSASEGMVDVDLHLFMVSVVVDSHLSSVYL